MVYKLLIVALSLGVFWLATSFTIIFLGIYKYRWFFIEPNKGVILAEISLAVGWGLFSLVCLFWMLRKPLKEKKGGDRNMSKEMIGINDKGGQPIGISDIVGDIYRNGYWFGIVEKPAFYLGTIVAIRVLDYWGIYFWDFITGKDEDWKNFREGNTYEILHSSFSGEYDVHPSRLNYCRLKCHLQYCDENYLSPVYKMSELTGKYELERGKEVKMPQ